MQHTDSESYLKRRTQVVSKRRIYDCPNCSTGSLVGYSCRPQTNLVHLDRYLAFELIPETRLFVEGEEFPYRNLARFHLFICTHCYYMIDGPVTLKEGKVSPEIRMIDLARRYDGRLANEEGGMTFAALFWHILRSHGAQLDGIDWFAQAKKNGLFNEKGMVFLDKAEQFNSLMRTVFHEQELSTALMLVDKLNQLLVRSLVDLVTINSFNVEPVLHTLYLYRLIQYTVLIGRRNDHPFRLSPKDEPLIRLAEYLFKLNDGRAVERSSSANLMLAASRMSQVAGNEQESAWARQIAFLSSCLALQSANLIYDNPEIDPNQLHENNEAARYLNLVLRKELNVDDSAPPRNRDTIQRELNLGLKLCADYGRGMGTPRERRACRMADQIGKLVRGAVDDGTLDKERFPNH